MTGLQTVLLESRILWTWVYVLTQFASGPTAMAATEIWQEAVEALKQNNFSAACRQLKGWSADKESQGIFSPEAQYNLALCSWQEKNTDTAVLHLLRASTQRSSILKRLEDLRLAGLLQQEIGIRDSLANNPFYIARFLSSADTLLILFLLGFWSFAFASVFLKRHRPLRAILRTAGFAHWTLILILLLNRESQGRIGVLSGETDIQLFNFASNGKLEKLADLPRGAMVEIGKTQNDFFQILKPVPGWVQSTSVHFVES